MVRKFYHPSIENLPQGFKYPAAFLDYINQAKMPDLDPWFIMGLDQDDPEECQDWLDILKEQYPERKLVPFAKCNYNDDVACFEQGDNPDLPVIFIIHTFTAPGYEEVDSMDTFEEWLDFAKTEARRYQLSKYGKIDPSLLDS